MTDDPQRWAEIDAYLEDKLLGADTPMASIRAANDAAGLPPIDVSPLFGRFLTLLVRISGARRVLEIGTLGATSTICLARPLDRHGHVVTIEADPDHAEIARANVARAALPARIDIRLGAALDTLPLLEGEGLAPFDFVFIDADKRNNAAYLHWARRLGRPGTVVVVDNVIRSGRIADPSDTDPAVTGNRELFDLLQNATALQTVGAKGWDGFAIEVLE